MKIKFTKVLLAQSEMVRLTIDLKLTAEDKQLLESSGTELPLYKFQGCPTRLAEGVVTYFGTPTHETDFFEKVRPKLLEDLNTLFRQLRELRDDPARYRQEEFDI